MRQIFSPRQIRQKSIFRKTESADKNVSRGQMSHQIVAFGEEFYSTRPQITPDLVLVAVIRPREGRIPQVWGR